MKKNLLKYWCLPVFLTFALLATCEKMNAQQGFPDVKPFVKKENPSKWHWGVKSGVNSSHILHFSPFKPLVDYSVRYRWDLVTFIFAEYRLGKDWSLQSGLSYSGKGAGYLLHDNWHSKGLVSERNKIPYILNYVEMPVQLYYHFKMPKIHHRFFMGVHPAKVLMRRYLEPAGSHNNDAMQPIYIPQLWETVKLWDLGYSFGTGIAIPVEKQHFLLLEASCTLGLLPVVKDMPSSRNQTFSLMIGYSF